ncbi:hypothetical protein DDD_0249 [Nonlabens dokdonensis DSW-6]|uniref:Uncharacterized protein n=1 Tax=Nonlabens dokdonensis (strain DSM 17205 / KCTC 12402 / DSW-6) TaxID=592029 RepID=L7W6H6_NONDD|nr:hypothetical protein DDD_0249 [Nonlabens dokdonensis DSW-6]
MHCFYIFYEQQNIIIFFTDSYFRIGLVLNSAFAKAVTTSTYKLRNSYFFYQIELSFYSNGVKIIFQLFQRYHQECH